MAAKPYASSLDTWKKHFLDMAAGKLHQSGFYRLGRNSQYGGSTEPVIELLTPTQQAILKGQSLSKEVKSW